MEENSNNNYICWEQLNFLEILSQTYDFDNSNNNNNDEFIQVNQERNMPTYFNLPAFTNSNTISNTQIIGRVVRLGGSQQQILDVNFNQSDEHHVHYDWFGIKNDEYFKFIEKSDINECLKIEKENISCSVCLCEFNFNDNHNDNKICQISCEHYFHKKCIDDWFNKKKNCPLCRKDCLTYNKKKEFFKNINLTNNLINERYNNIYNSIKGRKLIEYLLTTNIFYEDISIPGFGLISNLKVTWHEGNPCAFIVDLTNPIDENFTNPIMELDVLDIDCVMDQAGCNPKYAIQSLLCNNLDIVNALIDLSLVN